MLDPDKTCGSQMTYIYFVSFIFLCSFIMLNLFVAVIMDNFDYLTRDSSILGSHHLDEFIRIWADYDHSGTGKIHYNDMYRMLKEIDPPLGFGSNVPDRMAYKKLIRMNQPLDEDGNVNFTNTLFALIRENLQIAVRSADEMDQANSDLRKTILKIWPFTKHEKINYLVPPPSELGKGKLTVGKIYGGLLILGNWKTTRFGEISNDNLPNGMLSLDGMLPNGGTKSGIDAGDVFDQVMDAQTEQLINLEEEPNQMAEDLSQSMHQDSGMVESPSYGIPLPKRDDIYSTYDEFGFENDQAAPRQREDWRMPHARGSPHGLGNRRAHVRASWLADHEAGSRYGHPVPGMDKWRHWSSADYPSHYSRHSTSPEYGHRSMDYPPTHYSLPHYGTQSWRRLPRTPDKPSSLTIGGPTGVRHLPSHAAMNFPKVNSSPTHHGTGGYVYLGGMRRTATVDQGGWSSLDESPMSFEEAVIVGRGTRRLPFTPRKP